MNDANPLLSEQGQYWFQRHSKAWQESDGKTAPRMSVTKQEYAVLRANGTPWHEIGGEEAWAGVIVEVGSDE